MVVGWLKGATGTFAPALVFLAGALLLSGLLTLAFGRVARISLGAGEKIRG
jgi:hypothetical protein